MDEDILAELERQFTNVNLDKYWVRKVGDVELWLSPVDYTQNNRIQKALEGEFGIEEVKRLTLAAAVVGINGMDLRAVRFAGKTLKTRGRDGKAELVDLTEFVYRKIAGWDAELVVQAFDVYADIMRTHRKSLVKDIVFENARTDEEELSGLEERVSYLREKLGLAPLIEAQRIDQGDEPAEADEAPPEAPLEEEAPVVGKDVGTTFEGPEIDFDPFHVLKQSFVPPVPVPPPAVSYASPTPSTPAAIEKAMEARRASSPLAPGVKAHVAQPSVSGDVIEKGAARLVVDPPRVDQAAGSQSRNPRFKRAGAAR